MIKSNNQKPFSTSIKTFIYSSIDPSQSLNLYKATQGGYVVKPRDEASNKAEGPSQEEIERIERILNENIQRPKLAGTGSNSLGSATRYVSFLLITSPINKIDF